jgi:hypothetical protein
MRRALDAAAGQSVKALPIDVDQGRLSQASVYSHAFEDGAPGIYR